jgi:hypothetical protein
MEDIHKLTMQACVDHNLIKDFQNALSMHNIHSQDEVNGVAKRISIPEL